jgi:primosomal protein N'
MTWDSFITTGRVPLIIMLRHSCGYEANFHCKNCRLPLTYDERIGLYCPKCGRRITTICPGCGRPW